MMDDLAGAVERLKAARTRFATHAQQSRLAALEWPLRGDVRQEDRVRLARNADESADESAELAADLATAITAMEQVQGFWSEVARRWHIEDRAYFESEAQRAGFGSPMMMALHHVWKRDPKVAELEAERDAALERSRIDQRQCDEMTDTAAKAIQERDAALARLWEVEQQVTVLKRGIERIENMAVDDMAHKDHASARYEIANAIESLSFALRHDSTDEIVALLSPTPPKEDA